ncbi:MAG TPA: hypothetical protein VK858_00750, partial [Longimicrobiales bacterium]|nr:hypothetical protein [Longimicrobiales bacterium]
MRVHRGWSGNILALSMALALLAMPGSAQAQSPDVTRPTVVLTLATAFENGRPVGVDSTFAADVGEVCAIVEVEEGQEGRFWVVFDFLGSQSLLELQVDEESDLQWAAMAIPPEAKGQWAVSVVHEGNTLTSRLFTVGP